MIRLAEASAWHWSELESCTDQNRSISFWHLARARALAVLERGEDAAEALASARADAARVEDEQNRDVLVADLDALAAALL